MARRSPMIKPNLRTGVRAKLVIKHFDNKFEDYSWNSDFSEDTLTKPSDQCVLANCAKQKWNIVEKKFPKIDRFDPSIYTGLGGVAVLKIKKFGLDNLEQMKAIIDKLPMNKVRRRSVSFLCGHAGPLVIAAIIHHKTEDHCTFKKYLNRLLSMKKDVLDLSSDLPDEILYGRAGYLYALLFLNKHINPPPITDADIRSVIEAMLIRGQKLAKDKKFLCPLMYQWHDTYYLGAAHGIAGILYMLMQARHHLTDGELNQLIKPTIDYLVSLRFQSGNFPSSLGSDTDKLVQWCHGAPGFVFLFSLAYKVFGDKKYLNLALQCGDVVWERGLLRKGYSICHGVSGNAYCFLELFQTTQDIKHLYRAVKFAEWCVDYTKQHEEHSPDRPHSLFEGTAGPMYLLLDIQNPMEAKFPGFSL